MTNFRDFIYSGIFIQIKDAFGLGMTSLASLANTSVSIQIKNYFSICIIVNNVISSISFAKTF